MRILYTHQQETVVYAAEELKKYVIAMSGGKISPDIVHVSALDAAPDAVLLGTLADFGIENGEVYDPMLDDIIDVDIKGTSGYIAGSNYRSILMGVYKYCVSAGCCFIRPGADGDYVPHVDLTAHSFTYRKRADHPFRGQCSEGATSYEHMRDMVLWLPKVGLNMYMIEGLVPYAYMHKWYGHVWNRALRIPGQETDYDMLARYIGMLERDVKKTGIQFHNVGHGWMFEPLGIRHMSTKKEAAAIAALTDEQKRHLALTKGARQLKGNSTFFTQMCYSNPETREMLTDYLVSYVEQKPYVDFLHVWLADANKNHCCCEECMKKHPSDYYVMMLNELDEKLTARGLDMRIVLIAYNDTLRPPRTERFANPKRFVFLNTISIACGDAEEYEGEDPAYDRTEPATASPALAIKWHREWLEICKNIPSMIYEYRLYSFMFDDPAHMTMTREVYDDMHKLSRMPVDGSMSDQTARLAMPTTLPMVMMGETLFDLDVDYERVVSDYFTGAFGGDGAACRAYLETLSALFCVQNLRVTKLSDLEDEGIYTLPPEKRPWHHNPEAAKSFAKIGAHIDAFMPVIEHNVRAQTDEARRLSWIYLGYHAEICRMMADIYHSGAMGDMDGAVARFDAFWDYVSKIELDTHRALDMSLLLRNVKDKLGVKMPKYFD